MLEHRRPSAASLVGVVIATLVAACVGVAPASTPASAPYATPATTAAASDPPALEPAAFWRRVAPGGQSDEYANTVDDLMAHSDLVIRGAAVEVRPGRDFVSPTSGKTYYYATVEVEIVDVIHGRANPNQSGRLNVELYLGEDRAALRELGPTAPGGEVLLFLRNKAAEAASLGQDPGGPGAGRDCYRIAGPQGYVIDDGGAARTPAAEPGTALAALDGMPFDEVVESLPSGSPPPTD